MPNPGQTTEQWRSIKCFDDGMSYEVSDLGNVRRRIGGVQAHPDGTFGPRYVPVSQTDGFVMLTGSVRDEKQSVAGLVADAFPVEPDDD